MLTPTRRTRSEVLDVALVVPLQGPAGILGPSCELSARLAAEEANAAGGVLGRELRFTLVDGGASPAKVAAEVDDLITRGAVQAVTGWHISAVREVLAPRVGGRVPYVYTPLYEGGEQAPWVFLTGETPAGQLRPALRWFAHELGVRRWTVVGDDYVWPRSSARSARHYLAELGARLCDEIYVELGTDWYGDVLHRIVRSDCEAVLMFLVGHDAVAFNRAFAEAGLDREVLRFSPLMDQNMLLAAGADGTRGVFTAAGWFGTLPTAGSMDLLGRYHDRFGPYAPTLDGLGESCYEGVRLLAELAARAGSLDVGRLLAVSEGLVYDCPRGSVELHDRHLQQRMFLAVADGLRFDVIHQL